MGWYCPHHNTGVFGFYILIELLCTSSAYLTMIIVFSENLSWSIMELSRMMSCNICTINVKPKPWLSNFTDQDLNCCGVRWDALKNSLFIILTLSMNLCVSVCLGLSWRMDCDLDITWQCWDLESQNREPWLVVSWPRNIRQSCQSGGYK